MNQIRYEVFALRYATDSERSAVQNFLAADPHDCSPMPLDFYLWVIKGPGTVIVVDTGCTQQTAAARRRTYLHAPLDLLAQLGIQAHHVTDLVITHMHYDHCGNLDQFPAARVHVQEDELAYCTGRCMTHALLRQPFEADDVVQMVRRLYAGRVVFHRGSSELAEGIFVHQLDGHTRGLQVVCVSTQRGRLVLASDAMHLWANLQRQQPFPILVDVAATLDGYEQLATLADSLYHIIPGHDPRVRQVFPALDASGDIAVLHAEPQLQARAVAVVPS